MTFDWPSVITATVTGIVSGIVAGIRATRSADSKIAEQGRRIDDQGREITGLRDTRVAHVEKRVGDIEARCKADVNTQAIESFRPVLARIEGKIDDFTSRVSGLERDQKNTHEYLTHVDAELSAHKDAALLHGGRRNA